MTGFGNGKARNCTPSVKRRNRQKELVRKGRASWVPIRYGTIADASRAIQGEA